MPINDMQLQKLPARACLLTIQTLITWRHHTGRTPKGIFTLLSFKRSWIFLLRFLTKSIFWINLYPYSSLYPECDLRLNPAQCQETE